MDHVPRFDRGLARLDFAPDAQLAPGRAPAKRDPITGYVRVSAYLARDGLLVYGDGDRTWHELRSREELLRAAESFAHAPLTDLHPAAMVTADNASEVSRGHVITAPYVTEPDETGVSYLAAELLVKDRALIETMDAGQVELSIGFWARIVDAPAGTGAEKAQVDMLGNHVASVPRGRAGPACRVFLDRAASCAYDPTVSDSRTDLEATETVDYPMPDGTTMPIPTPVAKLLEAMQAKIAELSAKAAEDDENEPDMSEQAPPMPEAPEQPEEPAAEPEVNAAEEEANRRDGVRVDDATARAVIEARMPWLAGKLDGADLSTLLAAALAKPAEKTDADPKPVGNSFAEPKPVEKKIDEAIAPVAGYLSRIGRLPH